MDVAEAAAALAEGGVVAFPTDTVYGLGVAPGGEARIYEIKGRPAELPLILMVIDAEQARGIVEIDERAWGFVERWWPGPLTLVLPAGDGTLGVRVPDHPLALELLRAAGPLLTSSANRHGQPPALTADEAARLPGLAGVVDGGRAPGGVPSTVLDLSGPQPRIVREGAIPAARLLA